jgi:tetratricopeptide (TPR) repeat protein
VALARGGRAGEARAELAGIQAILAKADYGAFTAWGIPAKEVGEIAAHVLRARIAQADNDLDRAVQELERAVSLQDAMPYMEPPYWYYPIRQTLGAVLLLKGEPQRAREAFRESLGRTPNNAWALYGLAQSYERQGMREEAREVEKYLARAWSGSRSRLDLRSL